VVVSELAGGGVDGVEVEVEGTGTGTGDSFPENAFSMMALMIASSALLLLLGVEDFVFLARWRRQTQIQAVSIFHSYIWKGTNQTTAGSLLICHTIHLFAIAIFAIAIFAIAIFSLFERERESLSFLQ